MFALALVFCICALVPQFTLCENTLKLRNVDAPIHLKTKAIGSLLTNSSLSDIPSFNDYADSILQDLKEYSITYGLDPVELEDIQEDFEWRVLLITYRGQLNLANGWMQGLSTIYRTDDVTLTLSDRNFNIAVPVTMDYLLIDYKYDVKFIGIKYSGNVDARITGIDYILNLGLNSDTKKFTLNSIEVKDAGNIKMRLSGNALTDWLINIFSSVFTSIFQNLVINIIEGNFTEIFQYVLDIINQNNL